MNITDEMIKERAKGIRHLFTSCDGVLEYSALAMTLAHLQLQVEALQSATQPQMEESNETISELFITWLKETDRFDMYNEMLFSKRKLVFDSFKAGRGRASKKNKTN